MPETIMMKDRLSNLKEIKPNMRVRVAVGRGHKDGYVDKITESGVVYVRLWNNRRREYQGRTVMHYRNFVGVLPGERWQAATITNQNRS
ncbi:MAG: hypothetical protein GY952_13995 [Rhodobacteraceae bacterium]|nr:hypothetical protein [Paracoccaceae bacterium]